MSYTSSNALTDHSQFDSTCQVCRQAAGTGVACRFCGQVFGLPNGVMLSSAARRLAGFLLELFLYVVTLAVGWFIWGFVLYARGQTPAKQLLCMRIVSIRTGRTPSWGMMCLRENPVKTITFMLTFGVAFFSLLWDRNNQQLYDKLVGTIVVNDPLRLVIGSNRAARYIA